MEISGPKNAKKWHADKKSFPNDAKVIGFLGNGFQIILVWSCKLLVINWSIYLKPSVSEKGPRFGQLTWFTLHLNDFFGLSEPVAGAIVL